MPEDRVLSVSPLASDGQPLAVEAQVTDTLRLRLRELNRRFEGMLDGYEAGLAQLGSRLDLPPPPPMINGHRYSP